MLPLITHAQDVCRGLIADARSVCFQYDALACRRARLLRVLFAAVAVARRKQIKHLICISPGLFVGPHIVFANTLLATRTSSRAGRAYNCSSQ